MGELFLIKETGQGIINNLSVDKIISISNVQISENEVFVHEQSTASANWIINHTFSSKPLVNITDIAGNLVEAEIQYTSSSTVTIMFNMPFAGFAYLK